ncbi:virulence factor [Aestuariispira insulae]|uniref:CvfA/B/C family virulence factor n=1 Tax=Aestuariispira insulae TaxID=1461337 RepID=A0A3D9HRZ3_9PROT|nr:virulence factor [Aestuariispira insulae]RED52264.1 cvfA/B/C family virulence factor [Aestuariispira insulae]
MAQLIVVYWRDIPAQVIVKKGRRDQVKVVLDERFEKAIDRAAMRGDARGTEDYLAEWKKADPVEVSDDLQAEADKKAAELEAAYDDERLKVLVANGGNEA